ncbi:hypothetical protein K5M33_05610 [Chromobacterium vaccinii]|nr:hypothetical protein [Chromobacterium vaccinii]MBX9356184.1 hypothetical protein [Chromobacterium vaccinii]
MPIEKGPHFNDRDIFADYPFEEVMYRWDHKKKLIFAKFYGDAESIQPIEHTNKLFNDALLFGDEITRQQYLEGKSKQ